MKNLKKILMALVLVALLVSSVVTIAVADASYTGNVETAQQMLDAVYEATGESGPTADAKAPVLKSLYEYLITVNPQDEGYDEIRAAYNDMTFKVMHHYFKAYGAATTDDARSAALTKVYTYKTGAPVILGGDSDVVYSTEYVCKTCGESAAFKDFEFFDGLAADLECPGTCSESEQKIEYLIASGKSFSYIAFEKEFNSTALSMVEELIAYLYSLEEIGSDLSDKYASYYELAEDSKKVKEFLSSVLEKTYTPSESELYTGSVSEASKILAGTTDSSDFDKLKTALGAAYTYLSETPVNPTSDEYLGFIKKYDSLSDALILKLRENVAACTTPADKFAELNSFRAYLVGDGENPGTQISEKVVNAFNAIRTSLVEEYRNADELIGQLSEITAVVYVPKYSEELNAFAEKVAAAEVALEAGEDVADLVAGLYTSYVAVNAYNPEAEAYADVVSRYLAICEAYVSKTFKDAFVAANTVEGKLAVIVSFNAFLTENPVSENAINAYNELRESLSAKLGGYMGIIENAELPEYNAPAAVPGTASAAVLDSLLTILTDSLDNYNSYEDPAYKAAALEDMKLAAKDLYTYIIGVDLNKSADYYNDFFTEYSTTRTNVIAALFATVDAAEGEDAVTALEALGAFLAEVPLTYDAICDYNEKVDELVSDEDAAAGMKLDSIYFEIDSIICAIDETEGTAELMELAVQLYALRDNVFDITDPDYDKYLESEALAMKNVADSVSADIVIKLNASDMSEDAALVGGYIEFAESVYDAYVTGAVTKALADLYEDFEEIYTQITETNVNAGYISTAYDAVADIIERYDSAETLTERAEIFAVLSEAMNYDLFTTAFISGDSYAETLLEYERVYTALENEIIALVNADVSAYNLAKNLETVYVLLNENCFSQKALEAYNAVYAEVCTANFGEAVANIDVDCPAIEKYVPHDGWNSGLARIDIALEQSIDENGLVKGKYEIAYRILNGDIGVAGPQVIDFGVSGFVATITAFDDVKQNIVKSYNDKLDAAKTVEEKQEVLADLGSFIDEYPFSKKLVDGYNSIRNDLRDAFSQESNATFLLFQALVDDVYKQLESCPIDMKYLTDYQRELYSIGQSLLSAAEFSVVENYLEVAMGISGENALIYQNMAVDELNSSISSFSLGDFTEQLLVKSNLKFAFVKFIEEFDAELATLSASEKTKKINSAGAFIVSKEFPAELISLYNVKYGTNLVASAVEQGEAVGKLDEYAALLEGVMNADGASDSRLAVLALVEYVNGHKFSSENTSGELKEKLEKVKEELAKATQDQIDSLDELVSSEENGYAVEHNYDYENGKCNFGASYNAGDSTAKVVTDPVTGEKYAELNANSASSLQYLLAINDASQGIVLDFDIMAEGELSFLIYFYGNKKQIKAIEILDGVIQGLDTYPNYTAGSQPIKPTPGEWTHITIAFDIQKQTQELYIDYVSLGKKSVTITAADFQTSAGGRVKPYANKPAVCIDNFKVYHGTSYRTLGKLDSATDDEKFTAYMNTLLNEGEKATERLAAYYSAQSIKSFVTEECAELKAILDSFDITEIKVEAEATHLDKIKELVNKVNLAGITTQNIAESELAMSAANNYIEANRLYVDQMSPEFRAYNQTLLDAADKIVWLGNLNKYIDAVAKFHRATSYAAFTKHLENVTVYYELCELYDAEKVAMAAEDPVAVTFTANMKKDASVIALVPNFTFADYYETYIPARLAAQKNYENSVKIVDCIDFIEALVENKDSLTPDAYKEALLEAAKAEFDYVDSYMTIIRKIINSGEYDKTYEGLDGALEVFDLLDPTFFGALQTKHFEIIKAQLDKYAQTDSYIERAGICTFLRNYIEENDVDMSSEEGRKCIYALEVYEEELEGYMEDYEAILAENTKAFLGIVKKMKAYVTYAELKPLYEEAITKYYYNMNVDSEEVKAAILVFAEYEAMIQSWEENSAMLLGYAQDLKKAARKAQKFRALVRCSNYISGADEGVEGVGAAFELYAKELANYTASIEPTISESADASNVVSALRTNRLSATVLAIANSIINN